MEMQENDDNYNEEKDEGYDIEIYSKRAIFWFSLIFSPIFGGIMLAINLRAAGYRREGIQVLLFSVVYYLGQSYVLQLIKLPMVYLGGISLVLNALGAAVLCLYFFKKYFPEEDYYPKSILQPMLIAIIILVLNMVAMYQYMPQLMPK